MKKILQVMFVLSMMLSAGSAFADPPAAAAPAAPAAGAQAVGPNSGDCAANNTGAKQGGQAVGTDGKGVTSPSGGTAN